MQTNKKIPEKQQKCVCYASNNVLPGSNKPHVLLSGVGRVRLTAVHKMCAPTVSVCLREESAVDFNIMYYVLYGSRCNSSRKSGGKLFCVSVHCI